MYLIMTMLLDLWAPFEGESASPLHAGQSVTPALHPERIQEEE